MSKIGNFEKMLASGQDSALLRYSLGTACQAEGRIEDAIIHLARALDMDSGYSAAWKAYGKVLAEAGRTEDAAQAFTTGIGVAEARGDIQAAREMRVFLKRLTKSQ